MSNDSEPGSSFNDDRRDNNPFADSNPYKSAMSDGPGGRASELSDVGPGLVSHVVVVGVLMIVQGALNTVMGALLFVYALLFPRIMQEASRQQGGVTIDMDATFGMMLAFGIGTGIWILLSVSMVVAGAYASRFRHRTFAVVMLCSSLLSLFTCYCFPTSLALAIYGMIVLLNESVRVAFEMRKAGVTVDEIQEENARLRYSMTPGKSP